METLITLDTKQLTRYQLQSDLEDVGRHMRHLSCLISKAEANGESGIELDVWRKARHYSKSLYRSIKAKMKELEGNEEKQI